MSSYGRVFPNLFFKNDKFVARSLFGRDGGAAFTKQLARAFAIMASRELARPSLLMIWKKRCATLSVAFLWHDVCSVMVKQRMS